LLLALRAVGGLPVAGAPKAQQIAPADAIAEEAARAGAQAVDLAGTQRGGGPRLAAADARTAAQRYLDAADTTADTAVTGTVTLTTDQVRVEVTLTAPTVLLGLVGMDTVTTTGSAQAQVVAIDAGGEQ